MAAQGRHDDAAVARGKLSPPLFKKSIFVHKEFLRKQDDNQSNTPPTFTNISFVLLLFRKGISQSHDYLAH